MTWARTDLPRAVDAALLDIAEADGRVLLTLDKDFWQLAIQRRKSLERSGVIPFRVHPAIPESITPLVLRTMATDQVGDADADSRVHALLFEIRMESGIGQRLAGCAWNSGRAQTATSGTLKA